MKSPSAKATAQKNRRHPNLAERAASLRANQGLQLAEQCSALRRGKYLAFVPTMP
jgi:hypothetical protein